MQAAPAAVEAAVDKQAGVVHLCPLKFDVLEFHMFKKKHLESGGMSRLLRQEASSPKTKITCLQF